jgi:hypothetical protein
MMVGLKSLIFLAYDTFIFYWADLDHILYLRCLFLCFEVVSGLKINLTKLELVPIGNINNFLFFFFFFFFL